MSDEIGCKCAAHSKSEWCAVDWTPHEVYELRAERDIYRNALERIANYGDGGPGGMRWIAREALRSGASREAECWNGGG